MKKEAKSKKLRSQFNPNYHGTYYKVDFGESMTIPDQNLSVQELMERHTRGIGIGVAEREGMYLDEEGFEVKRPNDLTELVEYREELQQKFDELDAKIADEIDQQQAKEESETVETTETKEEETDKKE